jgi:hypothetical protein
VVVHNLGVVAVGIENLGGVGVRVGRGARRAARDRGSRPRSRLGSVKALRAPAYPSMSLFSSTNWLAMNIAPCGSAAERTTDFYSGEPAA